jgi:hypothetical protein
VTWLTLGATVQAGSEFQEEIARYDRYGCRETPDKGLCQITFNTAVLKAQQHYLRSFGIRGVSVDDVEKHLARHGTGGKIGGQPASLASSAMAAGRAAALAATGRAKAPPPPRPITPGEMDRDESRLDLRIQCMKSGGRFEGGRCVFTPRPTPKPRTREGCPEGYVESDGGCAWLAEQIEKELKPGSALQVGAALAVVTGVGLLAWLALR